MNNKESSQKNNNYVNNKLQKTCHSLKIGREHKKLT